MECQACGVGFRCLFKVPGDIWERIREPDKPDGLLCGECVAERIESMLETQYKERISVIVSWKKEDKGI